MTQRVYVRKLNKNGDFLWEVAVLANESGGDRNSPD